MPQTHPTAGITGTPPVPVSIFLHSPRRRSHRAPALAGPTDWCGVQPHDVAHLIVALTRPGDVVIDLDTHPTITEAARYLDRQPAQPLADGDRHRVRPAPPARRIIGRHDGAGLITARLPCTGADSLDLHGMTRAMQSWRRLLRPGGFLLTALTAHGPGAGQVSHRSTVITAARTAGLSWHQEFLVLKVPLPEYEPRAMPDTAATSPPALVNGRHQIVHIKVLGFQAQGGIDA